LGALLLGIVAGIVCFFAIHWIKRTLNIDDALDVFPVHGVGGMIGSLLTAPLALESMGGSGLPTGHGVWLQLGLQALAVIVALVWSGGISLLVLKLIDHFHGLRVGLDDETEGLDLSSHNGKGYHL
jgi:Amt family ammonium transporter